jgi:type IX secretion system PorP/SprF family membrane protein
MNIEDYDPTVIDDPTLSAGGGGIFYPDLRLGLLLYSDYIFVGLSVDQVLGDLLDFEDEDLVVNPQRSYAFSLGGIINVTDRLYLKPSVLLMDDSRAMTRADFNLLLMYDEAIGVGIGYRRSFNLFDRPEYVFNNNVGLLLLTEIRMGESFRLGYSFDYPMAGLWVGNSHELSLGFLVPSRRSRLRSPRYF